MTSLRTFDPDRPEPYRGPWQPFPNAVADDAGLTDGDRTLYLAIRRFHWENPGAPPDLEEIARLWGHRKTSIYPAVRRLAAGGHVVVSKHPKSRRFVVLKTTAAVARDYRDRAEAEVLKGRQSARTGMKAGRVRADPGDESARATTTDDPESARATTTEGGFPPICLQRFESEDVTSRALALGNGDEDTSPPEPPAAGPPAGPTPAAGAEPDPPAEPAVDPAQVEAWRADVARLPASHPRHRFARMALRTLEDPPAPPAERPQPAAAPPPESRPAPQAPAAYSQGLPRPGAKRRQVAAALSALVADGPDAVFVWASAKAAALGDEKAITARFWANCLLDLVPRPGGADALARLLIDADKPRVPASKKPHFVSAGLGRIGAEIPAVTPTCSEKTGPRPKFGDSPGPGRRTQSPNLSGQRIDR